MTISPCQCPNFLPEIPETSTDGYAILVPFFYFSVNDGVNDIKETTAINE
jgi:hypothetical protein